MAEWRHTVWPEAELVYTSIPKVANTSIKTALTTSFHPDVPRANRKAIHDESMPFIEVKPHEIRRLHPTFCHFAVVRNPFDRLVSFWADKMEGPQPLNDRLLGKGFVKAMSFAETVRRVAATDDRHADPHFRSQTFLLLDHDRELRVDLLLRFERLAEDWNLLRWLVAERTGAEVVGLPHRRLSEHRHFTDYFDDETWELAARRYATDIAKLGYDTSRFPPAPASCGPVDRELAAIMTARPDAAVLDLSTPTIERITRAESGGGHCLGIAPGSPIGHLVKYSALRHGRIDEAKFDVLIVRPSDVGRLAPYDWVHSRFVASGRTVVLCPERADRIVVRRVVHVAAKAGRRSRRLVGPLVVALRRFVRMVGSAGSRMSRRFRAT